MRTRPAVAADWRPLRGDGFGVHAAADDRCRGDSLFLPMDGEISDHRRARHAAEDDVLSLWQGLGYYSRARNLHRAAKALIAEHGGQIPPSLEALRSLPGVGDYTASAIRSFAFDSGGTGGRCQYRPGARALVDWRKPVDGAAGRAFLRNVARGLLPGEGWPASQFVPDGSWGPDLRRANPAV